MANTVSSKRSERVTLLVSTLQLPITSEQLALSAQKIWTFFEREQPEAGEDTLFIVLENAVSAWLGALTESSKLSQAIESALNAVGFQLNRRGEFTAFISKLAVQFSLQPSDAIKLGSQLHVVGRLATDFSMSASTIANALDGMFRVEKANSKVIAELVSYVGAVQNISVEDVERIMAQDLELLPNIFADSLVEDVAQNLTEMAHSLGIVADFGQQFQALLDHPPYVQMLHYQMVLVELFDFEVSNLYEFSPRGVAASKLFEIQSSMGLKTGAQNPFLNNAKSVHSADLNWALQKKPEQRKGAIALSEILSSLQKLSYQARQCFGVQIRLAVLHYIFTKSEIVDGLVPGDYNNGQKQNWLLHVASKNTATRGVFEQRAVDYAVACRHRSEHEKLYGLGDSVNATNLSRKKIGDVECIDSKRAKITAYEPHGGGLNQIYVDEHLKTLAKVLAIKKSALDLIAPPAEWTIVLVFVCHAGVLPEKEVTIQGYRITVKCVTFETMFVDINVANSSDIFDKLIINRLSEVGVHPDIRRRAKEQFER